MLQESRVLPGFEERTEVRDVKASMDLQGHPADLERKENLERTVLLVLMGLQDLLAPQGSEELSANPESEEREACWDCQVLLVNREKQEHLDLREALVLLGVSVYQEPLGQEEILDPRVLLELRGLLVRTA